MASLQAFPSSLLPRALIPFPFSFERLPLRLSKPRMALLLSTYTSLIIHLVCPPKILHNLKFFIVLGLQLSQENWRQCQLMFLRFVFFFGGGEGGRGGGKQGALWDNAHMANRVKSTLFWPLEKCRVSALDWRLTGTFSNMLNTMQTKLNHG